jgi:hypothetical protein
MAASKVADPISNVLQRTFQNGGSSYSPNKNHYNGFEGRGLIRGGSSTSVGSASHLDSSLQAAAKKTQLANSSVQVSMSSNLFPSLPTLRQNRLGRLSLP